MCGPSSNQTAIWSRAVEEIEATFLNPWDEEQLIRSTLGNDYDAYAQWVVTSQKPEHNFFRHVNATAFKQKLQSIDYNSAGSIYDFKKFLQMPNIEPIVIGKMNENTLLQLGPSSRQLVSHYSGTNYDDSTAVDRRAIMLDLILGLWSDKQSFRSGKHSDEGYASGGASRPTTTAEAPLEAFLQLGLLYSRGLDSISAETNLRKSTGWDATNYALVSNVYDDSIWVLWKKYIYYPDTCERGLAKDIWPGDYATFPGMDGRDSHLCEACGQLGGSESQHQYQSMSVFNLACTFRYEPSGGTHNCECKKDRPGWHPS